MGYVQGMSEKAKRCYYCGGLEGVSQRSLTFNTEDGAEFPLKRPCDRCKVAFLGQLVAELSDANSIADSMETSKYAGGSPKKVEDLLNLVKSEALKEVGEWLEITIDNLHHKIDQLENAKQIKKNMVSEN